MGKYGLSTMETTGEAGDVGRPPLPDRLRVLLSAAVELTAPQELQEVLQRIVESAAAVADARYAALGIYDSGGRVTTPDGLAFRTRPRPRPAGRSPRPLERG